MTCLRKQNKCYDVTVGKPRRQVEHSTCVVIPSLPFVDKVSNNRVNALKLYTRKQQVQVKK